jgi:hypothetical protein
MLHSLKKFFADISDSIVDSFFEDSPTEALTIEPNAALQSITNPQAVSDVTADAFLEEPIIDITTLEPSLIPQRTTSSYTERHLGTNWLRILVKPIPERRFTSHSAQINQETHQLYVDICVLVDRELRKSNSTLAFVCSQNNGHYGNILYTLYCIAEGEITQSYGRESGYNNTFSYSLLANRLDADTIRAIKDLGYKYTQNLPTPSHETMTVFNLTSSGLPYKWWDTDGEVRKRQTFALPDATILDRTPPRQTLIWHNSYEVRAQIIARYLHVINRLLNALNDPSCNWDEKDRFALTFLSASDTRDWPDYNTLQLLNCLLKLAEDRTRKSARYFHPLHIDEEESYVSRQIPEALRQEVLQLLDDSSLPKLSPTVLSQMRKSFISAWKIDAERAPLLDDQELLELFREYAGSEYLLKYSEAVIKTMQSRPVIQLLALYFIQKQNFPVAIRPQELKLVTKLVHPEMLHKFSQMISTDDSLSINLLVELELLTKAPIKQIILDQHAVQDLQARHLLTVSMLSEHLSDDDTEIPMAAQPQAQTLETIFAKMVTDTQPYDQAERDLVEKIITNNNSLTTVDGEGLVKSHRRMLNSVIQSINHKAYATLDDELLSVSDDTIWLDCTYVAYAREMMHL